MFFLEKNKIISKRYFYRFYWFQFTLFPNLYEQIAMRHPVVIFIILFWALIVFNAQAAFSQENEKTTTDTLPKTLTLYQAVMCEDIHTNAPRNQTVVFSVSKEKVVCFTSFDTVPEKTFIYHHWFYRDVPSARIRLLLRPPRWSTYSSIQIRKTDIGPWRVEITDVKGNILGVLRFSITD